ncbi:MAG: hypothetical protein BCS36_04740 [Desulfovibrio sp. MES5]|nr:MAG: hypothetical protein BCS36_04740 [Desulfovibrio sp. MES5]
MRFPVLVAPQAVHTQQSRLHPVSHALPQRQTENPLRHAGAGFQFTVKKTIRVLGGGGVGEETFLQKVSSPTKHFKAPLRAHCTANVLQKLTS